MNRKDLIITTLVSLIVTWFFLWWLSLFASLKVSPGYCAYPDNIRPVMLPLCLNSWKGNIVVFVIFFILVNSAWWLSKKLIQKFKNKK